MKKRSNLSIMFRLSALIKPLAGFMVLAIIMGVIGNLCAAFITVLGGYAILDALNISTGLSMLTAFILAGVFAFLRGILRYAEQSSNHYIAFKLLALIRDRVFVALRRLCPAKLEGKDKGNLISIITSDIELLEVFYAHTISPIAIAIIFCVVMVVFISMYSIILGMIALAAYVTVGVIIPIAVSKISGSDGENFRKKSGELSTFVLDSLHGISELIQFGSGKKRSDEMSEKTENLLKTEKAMKQKTGTNMAVTNTVIFVFDVTLLITAAFLYQSGLVGFDGVIIPVIALMSSFGPVVALANLGSTLQNTFAAGSRVLNILDESPVVEEITGKKDVAFNGAKAENVTFAYGDEIILNDVSADIKENSVVGIIGKSGSGKSTLLKLLMRFWQIQKGDIKISDTSIEDINTSNLRDIESYVLWSWGFLHITREGIRTAVFMAVRLILLIIGSSMLTLCTRPLSLTDGIERLLSPFKKIGLPAHEIAMMMTIALRFIPTLLDETDKIMKAQQARGADFESGSIIQRACCACFRRRFRTGSAERELRPHEHLRECCRRCSLPCRNRSRMHCMLCPRFGSVRQVSVSPAQNPFRMRIRPIRFRQTDSQHRFRRFRAAFSCLTQEF